MSVYIGFLYIIIASLIILSIRFYVKMKKYRQILSMSNKLKQLLNRIAHQVSMKTNKDEVCQTILQNLIDFMPCAEKGSLLLIDDEEMFEYAAVQGYTEELKEVKLRREELYLFKINNLREAAIINNPKTFDKGVLKEDKLKKFKKMNVLNIKSTLSIPIQLDGELCGLLNLDCIKLDNNFTEQEISIVNEIKSNIEIIFRNYTVKKQLFRLANEDELTGLYNRRHFNKLFKEEVRQCFSEKEEAYFVLIDIDDFKHINDTSGHIFGDIALQYFSAILRKYVTGYGIYARMSGDEFLILFKNLSKEEVINKIELIEDVIKKGSIKTPIKGISYGVVKVEQEVGSDIKKYLETADHKMYSQKREKKKH